MSLNEDPLVAGAVAVPPRRQLTRLLSLTRPRQWLKNVFVLGGLFFSHQLFKPSAVIAAITAAVVFTLLSAAMYCLNDILDRDADRAHSEKSHRALADGSVRVGQAAGLMAVLLAAAIVIAVIPRFDWHVYLLLGTYAAINALYSLWLKHVSLVDVVVVSTGFVLRLVVGTAAVGVSPTSWIVLSTGLLALLLALGKRRGDLERQGVGDRGSLGGYSREYIDMALGVTAAATLVVYAQFTVSDYSQRQFAAPLLYLTTFPVAIGILRYLQLLLVNKAYGSPTELVLRDRGIQVVLVIWLAMFFVFAYR